MIVFDIETGPLADAVIKERVGPYEPPPELGEFDPAAVKVDKRIKDEEKIKARIEAAREKHAQAVADRKKQVAEGEVEHWAKAKEKAALDPLLGEVLAIGYYSTDKNVTRLHVDFESVMLPIFWMQYEKCRKDGRRMVGHNIFGFDVPFLLRRSWLLGIDVPPGVIERGRYIDQRTFVDTQSLWFLGERKLIKLDELARLLNVGKKPDGIDGGMFAELLRTDPDVAEDYLRNDLDMTTQVAERLGVL